MKDGALLVNAARGVIVDTDALLAELTAGRLKAALDVTDPEPLPDGHPLWSAPGLLLTPHVGGAIRASRDRAYEVVGAQLARLAAGRAAAERHRPPTDTRAPPSQLPATPSGLTRPPARQRPRARLNRGRLAMTG